MATAYTSLLGFALPVTGELSGTWGDTVNDSITKLVEDSIAGAATVNVTSGNVTLTTTGSGLANQARCAIIIATGTPGTARQIIAPSQSKAYIVINQSDSDITFKGAATTGHVISPGQANLLAWNGSDYLDIEQGDVAGPASATDNAVARFDGTTGKLIQNSAVTIADTTGDIQTSGNIIVGDGTSSLPSITNVGDTNTGIYFSAADEVSIATGGVQRFVVDASGDVGIGVVPSVASRLTAQIGSVLAIDGGGGNSISNNGIFNTGWKYITSAASSQYEIGAGTHIWYNASSGTAGSAITYTQRMTLDANGHLLLGTTTSPSSGAYRIVNRPAGTNNPDSGMRNGGWSIASISGEPALYLSANINTSGVSTSSQTAKGGIGFEYVSASNPTDMVIGIFGTPSVASPVRFFNQTERMTITTAGFVQPVAYADTVNNLGNTGTATTINLQTGNVFTATLTGNCTFTLSNPIGTGSSSFTLVLTNDGTAGRTVAWSGGNFRFPGGAASLSRTTTANAVDIWAFFTPNGGTTWYGNIVMKNMAA